MVDPSPPREATLLEEWLQVVVVAHYFVAGITLFTAPAGIYLAIAGWPLAHPTREQIWSPPPGYEIFDPRVLGVIFFGLGVILGTLSIMHAWLIAYVARCIARRKRRLFCLIFSAFDLTYIPYGTVISGAALVLLLNKNVKAEFEAAQRGTSPAADYRPAG